MPYRPIHSNFSKSNLRSINLTMRKKHERCYFHWHFPVICYFRRKHFLYIIPMTSHFLTNTTFLHGKGRWIWNDWKYRRIPIEIRSLKLGIVKPKFYHNQWIFVETNAYTFVCFKHHFILRYALRFHLHYNIKWEMKLE